MFSKEASSMQPSLAGLANKKCASPVHKNRSPTAPAAPLLHFFPFGAALGFLAPPPAGAAPLRLPLPLAPPPAGGHDGVLVVSSGSWVRPAGSWVRLLG